MKKLMIIAAFFMANVAFTNSGVGEPEKILLNDSSQSEVQFNIESIHSNTLKVSVKGVQENFTSLSLIDQRGKTIFYQFVKTNNDSFEIDLADLLEGKYYVKLNMDNEIRMKIVMIEK